MPISDLLQDCKKVSGSDATFTWVNAKFLEEQKVSPWSDMPVWLPASGETAGASLVSASRAIARGLTFRPVGVTAKDTLDWWKTLPEERRAALKTGLTPEREAAALKAIREKKAKA
jgi:2'-hydroxyisoflavone reductase